MYSSNGHSKNGHRPKLSREDLQEIQGVIHWEMAELNAGREENVLLLEALTGQWSAERIIATAQQRGKNWRFLAALSDKALQIQGVGLLVVVAESTGVDLMEHSMRKTFAVINRMSAIYDRDVQRYGDSDYKARIYHEACEAVVGAFTQARTLYFQQVGRLILGMLEG